MLLEEQANKYRALHHWFITPQGTRVAHAFVSELTHVGEQISGGHLLQLGSCGENLWLQELKFRKKWLATPCRIQKKTSVMASLSMLPIERDSIDCVIAPLMMEAFPQGRSPLDEIDRVLKPMGYAIFFGINPCSFWGMALRWHRLPCFGPGRSSLLSSLALKRMMLQRGYRQCVLTSFYYIPPVLSEVSIRRLEFLNEMGKMIWPFPAGFYCLMVQKYQPCPPSFLLKVAKTELLLQRKFSWQALGKWTHEEQDNGSKALVNEMESH